MNTSRRTLTALALAAGSLTLIGSGIAQANSSDGPVRAAQGACTNVGTLDDDDGTAGQPPAVEGTANADVLCSFEGDDILKGLGGSDMLIAGLGDDTLSGGTGADFLMPGDGKDTVSGGAGDDFIDAQDGKADTISCGGGTDTVIIDSTAGNGVAETSVAANCENQVTGA